MISQVPSIKQLFERKESIKTHFLESLHLFAFCLVTIGLTTRAENFYDYISPDLDQHNLEQHCVPTKPAVMCLALDSVWGGCEGMDGVSGTIGGTFY